MPSHFDARHVRRAFARAANSYDAAAALQREVQSRLIESLDYLEARKPEVVLDIGAGTGHASALMKKRWPKAQVIALDVALPMLDQAKRQAGWWKPFQRLCGDAAALPLADNSVDVIFSNLCLQWVDDLPAVFAGFRRVLKPGGLLVCSTFGPETLIELNEAFAAADDRPHVSRFAQIAQFGDALMMAGFRDPVLDRDLFTLTYDDLPSLMRELRAMGATNARVDRRHTLTGRGRFAAAAAAYEPMRRADGKLPSSWEVIYAHAWAPDPGAPIREGGHDVASVPVSAIPIRRKQT
ncbi:MULTISPECIES: malonyl-ACP O-methyltransferase BioC [Stenotrophomonas]|jgi:malonyl-CoA O-methyltransferase|uniref:malonyl-ACP O-methyltransferase BioC n=1 Tax=Stenotrophomonas TaxID=40323 RepID=UPI00066DFDCF|nr:MULTISPECIES: malonyl-ACP O-methyltransferase BioC [Stenotrophomonas]EKT4090233.1 malonyl-ACP O-methyltransferase BioC [Stenotrophomonas maltophilia]MDV3509875.1 malonyl-ACP O-methyltransferase BioC [Stenotrophomonas sp. C4297]QDY51151.1 malonyl-[acyl-carrier protein] O-methyltransferase BioC [Stenotrophomonas maltophilia]VUL79903.1 Malonyl-[acyl-carrier protein] O-methyltransferase [Stenotrophomonas maltophilia]HEL3257995.1 malonyl-ACP O-methyltransferase BioC [Stenotrophomonas maltophilia